MDNSSLKKAIDYISRNLEKRKALKSMMAGVDEVGGHLRNYDIYIDV